MKNLISINSDVGMVAPKKKNYSFNTHAHIYVLAYGYRNREMKLGWEK